MPYLYSLSELFDEQKGEIKKTIYVGLPAVVTDVSKLESQQKINVRPLLNDLGEDGKIEKPPVIENVFVQFPSGGGGVLTFPIVKGDIVWLKFSSRSMDEWLNTGGTDNVTPLDKRVINYNDAVVDPCMGTFKNHNSPSPNHVELKYKGAVVRITKDGDVEISAKNIKYLAEDDLTFSAKNVIIEADNTTITSDISTSGSLDNNGVNVGSTHKHGGVTTGSSDTQGPQ